MRVVIIGAGPAGTACAIHLRQAGIGVTLLEKQLFPRHAPGETLHPGVEPLLQQLGVFEEIQNGNSLRHGGVVAQLNQGEKVFTPYHPAENWRGFQIIRESFDRILLERAVALGAECCQGVSITQVETDLAGRITGISTNQGALEADFFVDATGRNQFLARKMKINYTSDSPRLIAYYGYVQSKLRGTGPFDDPLMRWDNKGWTWIARISDDLISWNRLNVINDKIPLGWLPWELKDYRATCARKSAEVTWRIVNQVSNTNFFLVGDAAFVLDPASSHGVLKAIMSGTMSAYLINKVNTHKLSIDRAHTFYHSWLLDWYLKDVQKLRSIYERNEVSFWNKA